MYNHPLTGISVCVPSLFFIMSCPLLVLYTHKLIVFDTESQLGVLYPTIRRKLGLALNNLQPMDYSPHVILKPWVKVTTQLERIVVGWGSPFDFFVFLFGRFSLLK